MESAAPPLRPYPSKTLFWYLPTWVAAEERATFRVSASTGISHASQASSSVARVRIAEQPK